MWIYEKKLEYPVKIKNPNAKLAKAIISQLGGPDGELGASLRYLNQRFSMPYNEVIGILTDIGTEELAHMEIIAAIVHQLTKDLSIDEIKKAGFDAYFVDHTTGIYPVSAAGVPFTTSYLAVKGDVFADLNEDLAADATTAKEQPPFRKAENRWYYWLLGTLNLFAKMAYLLFIKNNITPIYTNFYKIHDRTSCFRKNLPT